MVDCDFNTDLYRHETIQHWIACYETLLTSIAANPAQPLATLNLLPAVARERILVDWNQTQHEYPSDQSVHQLFIQQAMRTPDAIAVVADQQSYTYGELNHRSNQVANYLRSCGVQREMLVGICLERSLDLVVGLLGILKTGAAYVPMDPIYPAQRLAYMIADAQMEFILTEQSLANELGEHNAVIICIDSDWAKIEEQADTFVQVEAEPENLAYVIYTSGSTGNPKGVQIPHRALTNFLCSMQREPGIKPDDVLVSVTTISFDIAALELYLPLITGARLVVIDPETATDGRVLADELKRHGATVMQATPATWRLLLESGWTGRDGLKMLCGGEALPVDLVQKLLMFEGELWNMYGPTETTIWSTTHRILPEETTISIGRPIANTQIYLLDKHLQPVSPGVVGELYIGGDGLARGYLNRDELTAEKFGQHPFDESPNARLYATGDLARYLPDGRIECLGRSDSQVKLRGFRIELGEIEATLNQQAGIRQAAVVVCEDGPGDKRLVAHLVAEEEQPSVSELRNGLRQYLPEYMIPATFIFLDAMPLTQNGKVDRKALPAPDGQEVLSEQEYVAPQTPVEIELASIWSDILNAPQVGLHDNFFDLGGHSLLATRMIVRLRDRLSRSKNQIPRGSTREKMIETTP
ncbi:amino acid adenylation domain-containing protein [Chloroflexi bacterium TSY]|nr:amino acid adenylation domain-containing protein [Chloroflexi bacterium TSY]